MAKRATVIFTPSGKRGKFEHGTSVLNAARQLGVDLDSVCGGRGICSRCQITPSFGDYPKYGVQVREDALSPWNETEERYNNKRGLAKGRRLGCQACIQGDMVIDVPPTSQLHRQIIRKAAEQRDIIIKPTIRLYYVEVEEPDMHKPSGDFERLRDALHTQWGLSKDVAIDIGLLRRLQGVLRKGNWKVTCAIHKGDRWRGAQIIAFWSGYYDGSIYGFAVDLGSTTIAAQLCDLQTGKIVGASGVMNPQIRFGEDLMSRVSYAMMNKDGDAEMTRAVREGISVLMAEIAKDAGVDRALIIDMVLVCNPVMHHLFLGIDPFELGQAPFALCMSGALSVSLRELELGLNPSGRMYILPCIAGHVGADAAAVVLSERPDLRDKLSLVVDVGTNAEIILGNKDRVLACSSPTGPAFEGAQISSGQRAAAGAIERVEINPKTKEPRFRVIGCELWSDEDGFDENIVSTGVTGICGSGIIEVVAEMRMAGIVDASGLIGSSEQTNSERCYLDGRTYSYKLYENPKTHNRISVTNADIRAIQMAKAALYSGARLLMDKFGVETVDRVVLAGAFGAHISPKHAMVLGMIPDCSLDKVVSTGNASGTGARIALLNNDARKDIEEIVRHIEKIETAVEARFQEHFVNASALPNAVEPFVKLRSVVNLPELSFNMGAKAQNLSSPRRRRRRL